MPLNEEAFISRVSIRHSVSPDVFVLSFGRFVRTAAPWPSLVIPTLEEFRNGRPV
jgi:hypothetical protein